MKFSSAQRSGPRPDEVEVSIFGPGVGECIVAHLTAGIWVVVDSLVCSQSRRPVALDYLDALGCDAESAVKLVLATHYHDDHIRGVYDLVAVCTSARFATSAAIREPDLLALVTARAKSPPFSMISGGVDELGSIVDHLLGSRPSDIVIASSGRELLAVSGHGGVSAKVIALSPSDVTFLRAQMALVAAPLSIGRRKRRVAAVSPNETSVVSRLSVGQLQVILGADLEARASGGRAWDDVVSGEVARGVRSQVLKVPHHGSKSAHHEGLWTDALVQRPIAALTPFRRLRDPIPTAGDVERIRARAGVTLAAAPSQLPKAVVRGAAVRRTLKEAGIVVRPKIGPIGHVRIRASVLTSSVAWSHECFEPAREL